MSRWTGPDGIKDEDRMAVPTLLVSNPPHKQPDAQAAAPSFALSAAEVRMKANYAIPEIWFADPEENKITASAENLRNTGFSVSILSGQDIADVPNQTNVESFSFSETGMSLNLGESEFELAYNSRCIAMFCQPLPLGGGAEPKATPDTLRSALSHSGQFGGGGKRQSMHDLMFGQAGTRAEDAACLDIFTSREGTVTRFSVFQDVADFSGLPTVLPSPVHNMAMLFGEFEERFNNAGIDKRLVGMRLRHRPTVSTLPGEVEPDPRRRRYSYATTALSKLLESISDELKEIGQTELSSRLVYLTTRENGVAT